MAKTYEQLRQQAVQIRDEYGQGENTAERIGNMHLEHLKWTNEMQTQTLAIESKVINVEKVSDVSSIL